MPGDGIDGRYVRSFARTPGAEVDESAWPATVPAVAQILREGFELPAGLTILVGENGSGKSTLVEMLAEALGMNPQGGSGQATLFQTRDSEPGLGAKLSVVRGSRPRWSYLSLRAWVCAWCGLVSHGEVRGSGGCPPESRAWRSCVPG
jgi:predicted ATPase